MTTVTRRNVQILAPTLLEYCAVLGASPQARARWAGVRLARWHGAREGSMVVVCGLAGALAPGLRPGTVLVPEWVGRDDGGTLRCDAALVQALAAASRRLGFQPDGRPLLTARSLITGDARREWFQRGYVAADMETGLLAGHTLRVATIRVVLDSPEHGISPEWLRPTRALLRPALWRELFWLCRAAPRYAWQAARVLNAGLGMLPSSKVVG